MKKYKYLLVTVIILLNSVQLFSQQIADTLYKVEIRKKMYPNQNGTIIHIDEEHNNFHTKDGRYFSFAQLLKSDGYRIKGNSTKFDTTTLKNIEILVIANALPDEMSRPIVTPTRSAFSQKEIQNLRKWVKRGGSLFIIADHMPFAGAASELAKEFGFDFYDSFVMNDSLSGIIDFDKTTGTLNNNFITKGRNIEEEVNRVRSFTGQGFKIPKNAKSLLKLNESQTVHLVDTMWVFNEKIKRFPAKGLSQGAIMTFGRGKIAVFGEAAMFSARLAGPNRIKVGMNSEEAKENHQLLLNTIHWLDGKLDDKNKYFRHLKYNHVSPFIDIIGIHPIDSIIAEKTSHYVFKYDSSNRLIEIINNHYYTEKTHSLASLGVYKVVFKYKDGKEIRTFYDPNNNRITNDRNVYKEVYLLDQSNLRKQLNFYDLNNNPMESNWEITEYQWEQSKEYIIERRYNLKRDLVTLSPYFEFRITGILLDKNGAPKGHYNLNEQLEVIENNVGVASYQDTYDEIGNHTKYIYHDKKDNLVMNQWNFAVGQKKYDTLGNFIELTLLDNNQDIIVTREIYSNVSIKTSPPASLKDSLEIKKQSLGYLVALQKLKPKLMDTVMNDSLNKITIGYDRKEMKQYGRPTSKKQMIEFAKSWNKSGAKFPLNPTNTIEILDIYNRIATVKIVSDNWVEYLQLIKLDNKWEIMNIIWQYRDVRMYKD